MEFAYAIHFWTVDGNEIVRTGKGVLYPTDIAGVLKLEDQIWQIAEDYNIRCERVHIDIMFKGEDDGSNTTKRIEGPKAKA